MNRLAYGKPLVVCFLLIWAIPDLLFSCINTSYSRKHEKQITGDMPKIIMGQFAEHGEDFYLAQLDSTAKTLKTDPKNFDARIDRAAAFMKLKRFEQSEQLLLKLAKDTPRRYKTHANLGVLYKKIGEFEKAIHHTELALEIRPEGHLGLGDYYLRMLRWRKDNPQPAAATKNFLGIRYADGPEATAQSPQANEQWLKTLIIADRHFVDAYWVLGDVLFEKGDLQNAVRCYWQAMRMVRLLEVTGDRKKSGPGIAAHTHLGNRISEIETTWREEADKNSELIIDYGFWDQLRSEQTAAGLWLMEFQLTEANLIAGGENPDFSRVKSKMNSNGVAEPKYIEAGIYEGIEISDGNHSDDLILVIVLILPWVFLISLGIVAVIFLVRTFRAGFAR